MAWGIKRFGIIKIWIRAHNQSISFDFMQPWRKCQLEALEAIRGAGNASGVVSMFCGTGKTRVIAEMLKDAVMKDLLKDATATANIAVAVFPRLVLADQFREKYAADVTHSDNVQFVLSDEHATTCDEAIVAKLRRISVFAV
jgi:superfamily II DNA or RNA helicase